jgi:photosystem II stability/assembly factor-like uncharacterized protein
MLDENTGWVAGQSGKIRKTTNGGANWIVQNQSTSGWITNMCMLNENVGYMCGRDQAIIKTIDGGTNWTQIFSNGTMQFNAVFFINENKGWALTSDSYIYNTVDGGANWDYVYLYNTGSGVKFIDENIGWVSGYSGAIYKTTNGGVIGLTDVENEVNIQVFPNPAIHEIHVQLEFPIYESVSIKLVDMMGRNVFNGNSILTDFNISTENIDNGLYTIFIEANECSVSKKIIINK